MATVKEEIIFEVDIESYIDQLAEAEVNINNLKKAQADFRKQTKEGNEEAAKSLQVVNAALKVAQDEYRATSRLVEGYAKQKKDEVDVTNFANNSILQNRALLKQLTEEYNKARNPSQEFTNRVKSLSDVLKSQESAIGNNTRSVGGYKEGILQAVQSINLMGTSVGNIIQPLQGMRLGFEAAGGGVKGFSAALATTGLPLIIAGIQGLINVFSDFAPVADAVQDATSGMAAGFRALIDGRSLEDAYDATVKLNEALRDLEDTQAAFNLTQAEGRNTIELLLLQAKDRTKTEQQRLEFLARANRTEEFLFNETKKRLDEEIKERTDYLQAVTGLSEKEIFLGLNGNQEQQKLFKDRLDGFVSYKESDLKELQDLILERARQEGESVKLRQLIKNRENDLKDDELKIKEDANKKKADADANALEERQKYLDNLEELEEQFGLDERERLSKSFDDKLKTIVGDSARERDLRLLILQEQALALEKFDNEQEEKRRKKQEDRVREAERVAMEIIDSEIRAQQTEEELARKRVANEQATTDAINELLKLQLENQRFFNEQNIVLTEENLEADFEANARQFETYQEFLKRRKAEYQSDVQAFQQAEATKRQAQEATLFATESISNSIIGLVGQVAEAQGAGAEFAKALAFVQILISQAIAIAQAVAGGVSSGTATGPGAIATIPVFIATLVGAVTAVIGGAFSLLSRPVPKYAEGGEVISVGGKAHSEGGTLYRGADGNAFEVERGEKIFVLKKTASERIGMLSAFNQMFGGRSWNGQSVSYAQNGGAITFPDGGFNARAQSTNTLDNAAALESALTRALSKMPSPVLSYKEFETNKQKVTISKEVATL